MTTRLHDVHCIITFQHSVRDASLPQACRSLSRISRLCCLSLSATATPRPPTSILCLAADPPMRCVPSSLAVECRVVSVHGRPPRAGSGGQVTGRAGKRGSRARCRVHPLPLPSSPSPQPSSARQSHTPLRHHVEGYHARRHHQGALQGAGSRHTHRACLLTPESLPLPGRCGGPPDSADHGADGRGGQEPPFCTLWL